SRSSRVETIPRPQHSSSETTTISIVSGESHPWSDIFRARWVRLRVTTLLKGRLHEDTQTHTQLLRHSRIRDGGNPSLLDHCGVFVTIRVADSGFKCYYHHL